MTENIEIQNIELENITKKLDIINDSEVNEKINEVVIESSVIESSVIDNSVIEKVNETNENNINYLKNTVSIWNSDIDVDNVNENDLTIKFNITNTNNTNNDNFINFENEKVHIKNSNITFSDEEINEIKLFKNNNNILDNISSINSGSEVSYTNIVKKQIPVINSKLTKHIRESKKKNKNKDNNEINEVDYLYNKLQDYMRYMNINRTNYIILIVKAMEIIENNNNLDKKNTVIKALNRIVLIDLHLSNFDQTLVLSSLNNIIEIIIICSKSNINKYKSKNNINIYNNDELILASAGQIIHSIIDKVTTIIIRKKYTADKLFVNICTVTDILMILVNKYSYINNIEKKTIVIQAFTIFVNEKLEYIIDLSKEKKNNLILALDSIPFIIDLLNALQNGKYKINRRIVNEKKNKTSCFRRFCCLN